VHRLALLSIAGVTAAAVAWRLDAGHDAPAPPAPTSTSAAAAAPPACGGFAMPVGPPDGTGYYNAQPFGTNDHLGDDWNGTCGGDSDLNDPVFAIADGVVTEARDHGGGWGNVVRVAHACGDGPGQEVESLYAHLGLIDVAVGQRVRRGQRVGTIGNAGGRYVAHLHLELRAARGLPLGGGYGADRTGYLDPTAFIARHHALSPESRRTPTR
jgi:murein DD-endopeptidase MepM/ murein hydrolase activator NlpD